MRGVRGGGGGGNDLWLEGLKRRTRGDKGQAGIKKEVHSAQPASHLMKTIETGVRAYILDWHVGRMASKECRHAGKEFQREKDKI